MRFYPTVSFKTCSSKKPFYHVSPSSSPAVCETYTYRTSVNGLLTGPPKWAPVEPLSLETAFSIHVRNNNLSSSSSIETEKPLKVIPNPANGQIKVEIPAQYQVLLNAELLSSDGSLIRKLKNLDSVDISDLIAGVYFIRLDTKTGSKIVSFVKI